MPDIITQSELADVLDLRQATKGLTACVNDIKVRLAQGANVESGDLRTDVRVRYRANLSAQAIRAVLGDRAYSSLVAHLPKTEVRCLWILPVCQKHWWAQ
jgi:hypothetical protein